MSNELGNKYAVFFIADSDGTSGWFHSTNENLFTYWHSIKCAELFDTEQDAIMAASKRRNEILEAKKPIKTNEKQPTWLSEMPPCEYEYVIIKIVADMTHLETH